MHLKGIFWVFLVFCLKYKCLAQIEVITGANLSQAWDEYLQEHTELLTLSSDLLADRKLIFDENMQNILTNNNDPATLFFMAPNNCTHLIFEECAVYYLGLDMTIPEPNQDTSNSSDTSSTTSSAPAADTATSSSTSSSSTTTTSSRAKDVAAKLLNEVREHQKAQKKLNKQKQKQQQQKQPKTHQTGHSKAATTTSSSSSSNGGLSDIAKGNRKQLKDYAHQERQEKHAHDNIIIKKGPNGERVSVTWSPGLRASPIDSTTPIPSFTDVNELKSSCSVDCIHGDYSTTFFTTEPITTTHWTTVTEPTTTTTLTSTIPTTTVPKSSTTQSTSASTSASTSTATSTTTASTTESTSTSTKTTTTPKTTTTTTSPTTTSTTSTTTTTKIPTTITPATTTTTKTTTTSTTTTTSAATTTYSTTVFTSTVSSKDYNTSWADLGFCGPVRYQGACGSCWAFATAGAIECAYMIKNNLKNKPIVLSVQQLLDCTYGNVTDPYGNKYGNDGCYGGGLFNTFVYSRYNKIVTDASYPFVDVGAFDNTTATSKYNLKLQSVTCGANSNYAVTGITNLISLPVLNETSILEAVNLQPVAAAMQVTNNFVYYKTGIFTDSTCATTVNTCYSSVNHAVIIVGYGSLNGVDYWILKNEWGTWWGENGFMRMKRGVNMCCITTDSYVPLL